VGSARRNLRGRHGVYRRHYPDGGAGLALCRTGRLPEAERLLDREGACLAWRRYLYAARTALAAGRVEESRRLRTLARHTAQTRPEDIEALWQRLLQMDL
jgi:hypothetical protein